MQTARLFRKPVALVVFLENVGHIAGLSLPQWTMDLIDFVTEEYAKILLRLLGAYRRYDKVIILEDEQATGIALRDTLLAASRTHRVDLLLLVHGQSGQLVGYRNRTRVDGETFGQLTRAYHDDPTALDLRMVYGLNCYGHSLAATWTGLGATVANGSVGVNWLPEPSLSVFLFHWLRGHSYSEAVHRSNHIANRFWRRIWRPQAGQPHHFLQSSRQVVVGAHDITINS